MLALADEFTTMFFAHFNVGRDSNRYPLWLRAKGSKSGLGQPDQCEGTLIGTELEMIFLQKHAEPWEYR